MCGVWQRASHLKEKGNSCFKANDLMGAEKKYAEAIAVLQVYHTHSVASPLIPGSTTTLRAV